MLLCSKCTFGLGITENNFYNPYTSLHFNLLPSMLQRIRSDSSHAFDEF